MLMSKVRMCRVRQAISRTNCRPLKLQLHMQESLFPKSTCFGAVSDHTVVEQWAANRRNQVPTTTTPVSDVWFCLPIFVASTLMSSFS